MTYKITYLALAIAALVIALALLTGCDPYKAPPVSGNERAFHLEHGAGAYTPRHGHQHYRWGQ